MTINRTSIPNFLRRHGPWIGLLALLGTVGVISFVRAQEAGRFDFEHFYLDAQYVWQHDQLPPPAERELPFYLPVVPLLLSPVAFGGRTVAAALWTAGQIACVAYILRELARWFTAHQRVPTAAGPLALLCLIAAPALYEASKFNQLSFLTLAILLAAFAALEREQRFTAGTLFGLATAIKLLPVVFIVWLLLKRQWRALAGCAAATLVVVFLPCLLAFGPARTTQYHREWWAHNVCGAPTRGMTDADLPEHFIDHRNQSLTAICARLFTADHPYRAPYQPFQLDAQTSTWLARGVLLGLLAGLVWLTRRPARELNERARRAEFAAYLLAMWVFSPLSRQYYLVWALPALTLFLRCALADPTSRRARLGRIAVLIWLGSMVAWAFETARLYGVHWLALVILGVLLLLTAAGPKPGAEPADPGGQPSK